MTPQTFLIESDNPYLLKALVEDLVEKGYKATWGEPYANCTYICSNSHINSGYDAIPYWKLYMDRSPDSVFHKTFKLPQDYQQAFNFAVEQLQIVNDIIKVEEKTGHLIPTKVYWSNNEIYPKGFIWRYKDIKTVAYIDSYSMLLINEEAFKTNIGLNDRGWENIREASAAEIKWLEACEKENKYITAEKALNPEPSIKVGDIVVVTERFYNSDATVGSIVKIAQIDNTTTPYRVKDYYKLYDWSLRLYWCKDVRLATQEEINKALLDKAKKDYPVGTIFISAYAPNSPTTFIVENDYYKLFGNDRIIVNSAGPSIYCNGNWAKIVKIKDDIRIATFGEVTFIIEGDNDYAETKYGRVSKESIKKAIDYIKNPPALAGQKLTIHADRYYELDNLPNTIKLGFGRQSGTLQELENILKCFS